MWQRAFAAKNKKSATQGMFWGTSIYMVTIALVFFMGLVAQQILPTWWPNTEVPTQWCLPLQSASFRPGSQAWP